MINTAIDYVHNVDTFAAVNYLIKQEDPFSIASSFNDVIKRLYWEEKDLPNTIAMGRAGIQYGLAAAAEVDEVNPEAAKEILLKVRALAFNVASYAWPGWDEEGFDPNETDVSFGYDAAKLLVRMCDEMDAEPIKFCRSWWMLGGYQLAVGKSDRAEQSFNLSAEYAVKAGAKSEDLLAQAFAILAKASAAEHRSELGQQLGEVKSALAQEEHGEAFVQQAEAAAKVFSIDI